MFLLVALNNAAVGPEDARDEEIAARLTVDVQSYPRSAHIALWRVDVHGGTFSTASTSKLSGAAREARPRPLERLVRPHLLRGLCSGFSLP